MLCFPNAENLSALLTFLLERKPLFPAVELVDLETDDDHAFVTVKFQDKQRDNQFQIRFVIGIHRVKCIMQSDVYEPAAQSLRSMIHDFLQYGDGWGLDVDTNVDNSEDLLDEQNKELLHKFIASR